LTKTFLSFESGTANHSVKLPLQSSGVLVFEATYFVFYLFYFLSPLLK